MPVSDIANNAILPAAPRRGLPERIAQPGNRTEQESGSAAGERTEAFADRSTATNRVAQRLESAEDVSRVESRPRQDNENLSFSARRALQTFADNTPTPGQRLGIELAGIDTFA